MKTRYYFDVLDARPYLNRQLADESLVDFVSRDAVCKCRARGVRIPSQARISVRVEEVFIVVEIYLQEEERVSCMQEKHFGICTY